MAEMISMSDDAAVSISMHGAPPDESEWHTGDEDFELGFRTANDRSVRKASFVAVFRTFSADRIYLSTP